MKKPILLPAMRPSFLLLVLALALAAITGHAQTSQYMTYQGYLTDGNGNPLGSTNTGPKAYSVVFRIWSAASGGTEYYGELQTVTVDNGYFSVLLGQGSQYSSEPHPLLSSVFQNNPPSSYIEMTVLGIGTSGANVTIAPRLQLVSTPYAYVAGSATAFVNSNGQTLMAGSATNVVIGQLQVTNITASTVASGIVTTTNLSASTVAAAVISATNINATTIVATNLSTATLSVTTAGPLSASTLSANQVQVTNQLIVAGGRVGIGTNAPSSPLSVSGTVAVQGLIDMDAAQTQNLPNATTTLNTPNNLYDIRFGGPGVGEGINCNRVSGSPNAYGLSFFTDFTNRMVISQNGYVGIGTASPNYPLDVETPNLGRYNFVGNTYGYLSSIGGYGEGTATYTATNISIFASGRIVVGAEFDCISDARVKEIVDRSDPGADLAAVRKLKITDYRKLDRAEYGGRLEKGVIAQEVETVVPGAVSTSVNFIPNIYACAQSFSHAGQVLTVTLARPHGLAVGDKVKFITESGIMTAGVSAVNSPTEFAVDQVSQAPRQLFVYGKQVDDFRSVNYDRLFTTGLGAIQELARRVDDLDAREARLADLEQKAARVDSLEQEVAGLKQIVAQLAEAARNSKSTASTSGSTAPTMTTASLDH